jgi:hypothetical protein
MVSPQYAEGLAMGRIVIVAFRPRPGRQQALESLIRRHDQLLRAEGLVSDRRPTLMRAADGTMVQLLEWVVPVETIRGAPVLRSMRAEFEAVAEFVPLADVPEARQLFADFEAVDAAGALFPELSP